MSEDKSPEISVGAAEESNAAELGGMLRETRIAFQRELSDVASELRIRLVYLEAIEEGRLDRLPGPTYASGFLRAYGDYLGLDGSDLVNKFKLAGGVGPGRMDLQLPSPVEEGRLPTGSILLVAAMLAFGAYGGWYYLSSQGRDPMKFVASLPAHLVALVGGKIDAQPEVKTMADADPVENQTPAAETPASELSDEPDRTAEETSAAPESPNPTAVVSEQSLNSENAEETKIVDKVEAVTSASAAPILPDAPPAELPSDAPPPVPADPQISTPVTAGPAATVSSDVIEKTEPAIDAVDTPPVRQPPPSRPIAIAPVAPVEPETPAVSTASIVAPVAPPSQPTADKYTVPESGVAAKVVVNTLPALPAAQVSTPTPTQNAYADRVIVRATADSWVEVRSGDQDPMLSKVLHAGEIYEVPPLPGLMLATGNAGGILIVVNGRALPLLGPLGAVRRDVALDPESLLAAIDQAR